jgi:hypothetical protein
VSLKINLFVTAVVGLVGSGALAGNPTYTSAFRDVYADIPYVTPPPGETYTEYVSANGPGIFSRGASASFFNIGYGYAFQASQIGDAHVSARAGVSAKMTGQGSPAWAATRLDVEFDIAEPQTMVLSWLLTTPQYEFGNPDPAYGGVFFEGPSILYQSDVDGNEFEWTGMAPAGHYRLAFSLAWVEGGFGEQWHERDIELFLSIPSPGSFALIVGGVLLQGRRARRFV